MLFNSFSKWTMILFTIKISNLLIKNVYELNMLNFWKIFTRINFSKWAILKNQVWLRNTYQKICGNGCQLKPALVQLFMIAVDQRSSFQTVMLVYTLQVFFFPWIFKNDTLILTWNFFKIQNATIHLVIYSIQLLGIITKLM